MINKINTLVLIKQILRNIIEETIIFIAKITKTNLLVTAYKKRGILNYQNDVISGERFVIKYILKKYVHSDHPIFFDIGAHEGKYSRVLKEEHPNSIIYSFEPNPHAHKKFLMDVKMKGLHIFNVGMGSGKKQSVIHDYANRLGSQHASIHRKVLEDIHNSNEITEIPISIDTIDNFCSTNHIKSIDFLKIDTEGTEFEVLLGAKSLLDKGGIKIIQFEFNEMNIISRVFLKDYYDLLTEYNLYRTSPNKLIPLPVYSTQNEIFQYQNFIAIHKSICL